MNKGGSLGDKTNKTKKKPVRITYAAIGGGSAPVWTAFDAGIFERNGLDVDLFMIRGSREVTKALLAGEVQFANIASPGPLMASLEGSRDLVYLTGGINYMVQTLVTLPEITKAEQLKGKAIGKSGNGSDLDDVLLEYIGPKLGLDPHRDLSHVAIKNQPDAIAKLQRKEIAAALLTPPWLFVATKQGFNVLMDPMDFMLDYQLGGIVATKDQVAADPDLVQRVIKSYVEGVHYFKRHPDFVVSLLKKYSQIEDREVALKCYQQYAEFFLAKPYPTAKGIQTVLNHLSRQIPEAGKVSAERFIDRRWLKELDDGGFIDELYRREPANA